VDSDTQGTPQLTVLERLDLALASQAVGSLAANDNAGSTSTHGLRIVTEDPTRHAWIAGVLSLRGLRVTAEEVRQILAGGTSRFRPDHQEHKLVSGLARVLADAERRALQGGMPDGWWLVDQFRRATELVGRFRNNVLRRDEPWDSIPGVVYPRPDDLEARIDAFHSGQSFGDDPAVFTDLHPVRQGFRLLWRFARIAPFPDLNLSFAVIAFATWTRAHGYPLLTLEHGDRQRLERMVRGRCPLRMVPMELRLLDQVHLGAVRS
jgi:hypothetical protein